MALLKIIALEPPDVTIVSAHLQDAVVKVGDMAYSAFDRRFVMVCNRFDRQAAVSTVDNGERRRAALRIERVTHVQVKGFRAADRATVLSVLALTFTPDADPQRAPAGVVTVVCAGDATLRLEAECVELVLEDLGPAWQAAAVPHHSGD